MRRQTQILSTARLSGAGKCSECGDSKVGGAVFPFHQPRSKNNYPVVSKSRRLLLSAIRKKPLKPSFIKIRAEKDQLE